MVFEGVKLEVEGDDQEMIGDEPVSPTGQYFNSSVLSVTILALFEFEIPIDDSPTISTLENLFLPLSPRFSSIMVRDEHGDLQWKRVKIKLADHVKIPVFPAGLESYDDCVQDYLSKMAMDPLPQNLPLWELHLIKYPTRNAAGTMVFKLHHALGDGFSLMGALFSCVKRDSDASLPLTFPSSRAKPVQEDGKMFRKVPRVLSVCINSIRDFGWSLLKSTFVEDDITPVRSGAVGIEFRPIAISSTVFSLNDIQQIKDKLGGTVNDVITGIIFYGTQLYLQSASQLKQGSKASQVTALVLLNTRAISNYQNVKDMTKPNSKTPWGNQFGFLHISIPKCNDANEANPLDFVLKAREVIKSKRSSLGVFLTGRLLELLRKFRGPEATAQYIHATLKNTSMTISNLTGPIEQMNIAGQAVKSFYFMVVGVPQSLTISVVSYMGKLILAMGAEKGFINSELLISCMEKSFESIFEAAVGKRTWNGGNSMQDS